MKDFTLEFNTKYPLDFVKFLSSPLKVLLDMGWVKTGYSLLGQDNPGILLSKDAHEALLTFRSPVGDQDAKKILIMNGLFVELEDSEKIEELVSELEQKAFSKNDNKEGK